MKKMCVFLSILVVANFIYCKKTSNEPIVGIWEVVEATGIAADSNKGVIYEFDSDSNAKVGSGILTSKGKYAVQGNILTITYPNNVEFKAEIKFEDNNKRMILKNLKTSGSYTQVFTLTKKE